MKKIRMLGTAAAAAIVVVGTVPPSSGRLAANFLMFDMGDSPVSVSDGSIHGYINGVDLRHWIEKTPNQFYAADAKDIDYVAFEGFTDDSGNAPPSPLQSTGGWLILMSNGDPTQATANQDSIAFCSTASDTGCILGTPDPNEPVQYVYLETHPDANPNPTSGHYGRYGKWKPDFPILARKINFQDNRGGGCDQGKGNCDHILNITIETVNGSGVKRTDGKKVALPGPQGHTYTCDVTDKCTIKVGQY